MNPVLVEIIMMAPMVIIISAGLIGAIFLLTKDFLPGGIIAGVDILFLSACLRKITPAPPHVGLVMIWGRLIPRIKKAGWRLLAPFPLLMLDVLPVNVEKKNKDFQPKEVRSGDNAELEIEVSLTYTPETEIGQNLIEYIKSGGQHGVENILDDMIEQVLREWARGKGTWEDCVNAKTEATAEIIKEMTGITEDIEISKIRRGNGMARVPSLGIMLNRLNVGKVKALGDLAKQAEKKAVEIVQREGEKVELQHVRDRAKELVELGLSPKDAVEVIQTERGKVKKTIEEKKYTGLEGLAEAVGRALGIFQK